MKPLIRIVTFLLVMVAAVAQAQVESININSADMEQLTQLKGIGVKIAERIIQYREEHGPFASADGIQNVRGIGSKVFQMNQGRIVVAAPAVK